jgi:hypothetical protein
VNSYNIIKIILEIYPNLLNSDTIECILFKILDEYDYVKRMAIEIIKQKLVISTIAQPIIITFINQLNTANPQTKKVTINVIKIIAEANSNLIDESVTGALVQSLNSNDKVEIKKVAINVIKIIAETNSNLINENVMDALVQSLSSDKATEIKNTAINAISAILKVECNNSLITVELVNALINRLSDGNKNAISLVLHAIEVMAEGVTAQLISKEMLNALVSTFNDSSDSIKNKAVSIITKISVNSLTIVKEKIDSLCISLQNDQDNLSTLEKKKYITTIDVMYKATPQLFNDFQRNLLTGAKSSTSLLCIDASIYDPNYHKPFEKLVTNLQLIGAEVSHNVISIGYYIMDNIYVKNDNSNNNPAPLMIEDDPYSNPQSKTKTSVNFNDLLYKSTISFKSLDFMIDTSRFINEPNVENVQKTLRDVVHLQSIFAGNNMYSMALSFIDITNQLSKGKIQEAGIQAITSISYMAIPTMLSFTGIPYLGFAYGSLMAGYSGYHAVSNAYSLYSEYGTVEWQLKSAIAYKDLYEVFANSPLQYTYDFASNAKQYEIKANTIKLEMEKAQIKQHLEAKGEFGDKLYDYIYSPMLEEKYSLLNKIISGELTEEQAATLKAKHISMTIGEQHYEHCMEVKNDVMVITTEEYYCYNENQQILDHIILGQEGAVLTIEKL